MPLSDSDRVSIGMKCKHANMELVSAETFDHDRRLDVTVKSRRPGKTVSVGAWHEDRLTWGRMSVDQREEVIRRAVRMLGDR